jgi:enamine deaminase RidA (YjgF/YER057c/UK114 family)
MRQVKYKGKLGKDISLDGSQAAARLCAINALSKLKDILNSLDQIEKFDKVSGYVNCDPSFTDHTKVINCASDFLVQLFGEKGKHTRVAVEVNSLPFDSSFEIEFIVETGQPSMDSCFCRVF